MTGSTLVRHTKLKKIAPKNGPISSIVFEREKPPKMDLKWTKKLSKAVQNGIPKTDPQKPTQKWDLRHPSHTDVKVLVSDRDQKGIQNGA